MQPDRDRFSDADAGADHTGCRNVAQWTDDGVVPHQGMGRDDGTSANFGILRNGGKLHHTSAWRQFHSWGDKSPLADDVWQAIIGQIAAQEYLLGEVIAVGHVDGKGKVIAFFDEAGNISNGTQNRIPVDDLPHVVIITIPGNFVFQIAKIASIVLHDLRDQGTFSSAADDDDFFGQSFCDDG